VYQFTSQLSDTPPWYASQWSYDPSHRCSTTELEYVEVPSQLCVIRLSHCHLTLMVMLMQVLMKLMQSSHSRLSEKKSSQTNHNQLYNGSSLCSIRFQTQCLQISCHLYDICIDQNVSNAAFQKN